MQPFKKEMHLFCHAVQPCSKGVQASSLKGQGAQVRSTQSTHVVMEWASVVNEWSSVVHECSSVMKE